MMSWDDRTWNVFHQGDNADDAYYLWIKSSALDAARQGEHAWTFVNKTTGQQDNTMNWDTWVC